MRATVPASRDAALPAARVSPIAGASERGSRRHDEDSARTRQPRRGRGAAGPAVGRADATLAGEFPDRSRPFRLGPGGDPRPRHGQEGGGAGQCDARGITATDGRRHRHGRRRGHRRQARPRVSARCVPDRLRHANQHERQRGHRPSRQPRRRGHHPPQRRRQPQPVLERRLSGGDAHRRRRDGRRPAAAGACRVARRRSPSAAGRSARLSSSGAPI